MVRHNPNPNLELFGHERVQVPAAQVQSNRLIGKAWVAPEHKPTKAVPDSLLTTDPAAFASAANLATHLVEKLHRRLGKPHTHREGFVLYNLDCREVMAAMKAVGIQVDLALTSPPYNIGKEYERPLPLEEYLAWATAWLEDIWNLSTERGALWLNLGYVPVPNLGRAVPLPYLLWNKTKFFLQQEVVWHYGAGVSSKRMFCPRNEKWLFFTRSQDDYVFNLDHVRDPNVKYPNQKKNGRFRCNPLGKNPSDVWMIPKVTTGRDRSAKERSGHPAQFPLELVDRIVKVSSISSQIVLDPFCGSGSTGIAAIGNGRTFIGAEVRTDYCTMAAKRLGEYVRLRDAQPTQTRIID